MTETTEFFTDNKFEKKLNQDRFLIGFENGVYDLKKMKFRDGNPNDYINISCGYDYDSNAYNDKLNQVIGQILPNKNVREYVLKIFWIMFVRRSEKSKVFLFQWFW